mmetsp:Transcript_15636/g.38535  ORF Transcript_15636/g.38535 Transcript_15636/m.38535 type:complete len:81 (+) Transcript_15636:85-327(+)
MDALLQLAAKPAVTVEGDGASFFHPSIHRAIPPVLKLAAGLSQCWIIKISLSSFSRGNRIPPAGVIAQIETHSLRLKCLE